VVGDLIGQGAAQEQAVVGETPNLAARLQALAEPGAVVIAPGTRRLTGGLFDYEVYSASGGMPRRYIIPAPTSSARASSSCGRGIGATAAISSCENRRPSAAPICATSRTGARRSSRAKSEACKLAGIASGVIPGPVSAAV
jgi:hypothetical protein